MIVLLHGKRGSGKTTLSRMLVKNKNYDHIELSQYLLNLKNRAEYKDMVLRDYVELMEKTKSATYLIDLLLKEIIDANNKRIVISGIRHIEEIIYIKNKISNKKIISIYLASNISKRFFRTIKRDDRKSIYEFLIEEYYSQKWGNSKIKKQASKIRNNKNVKDAYEQICTFINNENNSLNS